MACYVVELTQENISIVMGRMSRWEEWEQGVEETREEVGGLGTRRKIIPIHHTLCTAGLEWVNHIIVVKVILHVIVLL